MRWRSFSVTGRHRPAGWVATGVRWGTRPQALCHDETVSVDQHVSVGTGQSRVVGVSVAVFAVLTSVALFYSDGMDPGSFPPDASLFTVQNWLQVLAILLGGLLLASRSASNQLRLGSSGVILASSGLLAGSALVAVKHWRPYGGMGVGYAHTHQMEILALAIAASSFVMAALVLWWMVRVSGFPTQTRPRIRLVAIVAGVGLIVAVPLLVGMGSSETMDARSLGAFLLIYGLPWGLAVIMTAFMTREVSLGVLGVAVVSSGLTIVLPPMPDLVFGSAIPGGVAGLVVSASLMIQRGRGRTAAA